MHKQNTFSKRHVRQRRPTARRAMLTMGLCKQMKEDGHLAAGACGLTTWNETVENLSDAHVSREGKCIMALSEDAEGESEEEYADAPHGDEKICYAIPQAAKHIRDAM